MSSQNDVIIQRLFHHKTHFQRRKIFSTLQATKKNLQWTSKVAHTLSPSPISKYLELGRPFLLTSYMYDPEI